MCSKGQKPQMNALVVNDLGKKEIIGDMLNQLAVEDILTPDFCQLSLKDRKRRPEGVEWEP